MRISRSNSQKLRVLYIQNILKRKYYRFFNFYYNNILVCILRKFINHFDNSGNFYLNIFGKNFIQVFNQWGNSIIIINPSSFHYQSYLNHKVHTQFHYFTWIFLVNFLHTQEDIQHDKFLNFQKFIQNMGN